MAEVQYKPTTKEMGAINMIYERMEKMKRKRQEYEQDWNDADKQRLMHRTDRPRDEWRSDLKLPDTFSVIETAKAEMADQSPGIIYRPREPGDTVKAEKHTKIFDYTWEKGRGDLELLNFIDDTLVYGIAIGEEYWRQDNVEQKSLEEFDMEKFQPTSWKKTEKTIYDDVYFESIPIWSFYWDPMGTSLDNCRDVAKILVMPTDDFQRKYKQYPNSKKAGAGGPSSNATFGRPEWYIPIGNVDDYEVEIIHYYNKAEDLYLILANGVLLTNWDNPIPYKHKDFPFVRGVDVLIPHSFVGLGEPKILKGLQDERNTIRNMRIDTTHLNIQKQYIVDDRLELDDEDLIARPHGILRGPIDSISVVPQNPVHAEAYREEEFINDDMIKASGIDIRMQSLEGRGDTATEVAILKESSLKRIRLKLKILEKMALHRVGRLRLSNVQQFYTIPKIKKIIGEDGIEEKETFRDIGFETPQGDYAWFTARPDDLVGEYDIIVLPGATLPVSKALESQKRINLFDRLIPLAESGIVDPVELARMLIVAHDEDPDKLLAKKQQAGPGGQQGGMPPAMPPVGVGRSAPSPGIRPEEALPGRAMAGGSPL